MINLKWTKEQQEAIEIRDKNILVSAAAGSGKTAVLVERIKKLIINDQIPLEKMLVVTFSNAAASEMREKIVEALSQEIDKSGHEDVNIQKSHFLRNQLNLIHRANISTFHAFSMEVIRRYYYLINVEPNFNICDEAQKIILQAEAMEQLFDRMFELSNQDFLYFLKKYSTTKNENIVKDMILDAYHFIQSIPNSFEWLKEKTEYLGISKEDFIQGSGFKEIKLAILSGLSLSKSCYIQVRDILELYGIESLIPKCCLEIETLEKAIDIFNTKSYDEAAAFIREIKFQTYRTSKDENDSYGEIKDQVSALRDRGKEILKKLIGQFMLRSLDEYVEDMNQTCNDARLLYSLVEEFNSLYREKKKIKGLMDFNDIEHFALSVLSHEEAALEYRNKFDAIFIDEYQDSNIVQETLINRIKKDNNLFMVGDVKQSIYKFRLAEPEIFINKYESFKINANSKDIKIDLNRNFRSKGNIINAVNDIFSQIMRKDISGLDYDDAAALYKGVAYEGSMDYPVELHIVDDMQLESIEIDDEIKEMRRAEVEAYTAAQIIKETKGKEIYDAKNDVIRNLSNKDIVILLRGAKGTAEIYYEALTKEGISAFIDTSDGYFDTIEIEVFLNLLRIIDNKKQDIPFISVLRSSICDFSIDELIKIRLLNRRDSFYKSFHDYCILGEDKDIKEKCNSTLNQISIWKRESSFMPLEDFLWKLVSETGYYEYIGAIPAGVQRQANLRALIDKAVQFQNSQMKGLFSFINYIEAIKKRKVSMGQVKLLGENDDVVRIMTIHKSKGLEFPMVLVGGLGKKFNRENNSNRVSMHKEIGLGIRYVDKNNACYKKTIMQTAIEQKKSKEGMAEEIRILYVAFTRAMDKLVLLGTLTNIEESIKALTLQNEDLTNAKSYLDLLIPALSQSNIDYKSYNRRDISITKETTDKQKDIIKAILSEEDVDFDVIGETGQEIGRRLSYKYGYHEALNLKSKFTVSELNKLTNGQLYKNITLESLTVPKFSQIGKGFSRAEKGTILHTVMEYIDFKKIADLYPVQRDKEAIIKYINELIVELVHKEILTEDEATVVDTHKIIKFFDSDIGKRACKSNKLKKEVSFNIMKEVSGEKIIIQGIIDCYFEEAGKYILLDYKTNFINNTDDQVELDNLVEGYRPQLSLYKEALETIRGIKVEESYLYLFYIDKEIRVS